MDGEKCVWGGGGGGREKIEIERKIGANIIMTARHSYYINLTNLLTY